MYIAFFICVMSVRGASGSSSVLTFFAALDFLAGLIAAFTSGSSSSVLTLPFVLAAAAAFNTGSSSTSSSSCGSFLALRLSEAALGFAGIPFTAVLVLDAALPESSKLLDSSSVGASSLLVLEAFVVFVVNDLGSGAGAAAAFGLPRVRVVALPVASVA